MNNDQSIKTLVEQLIALGDDCDELFFWADLYPSLDEEEQVALKENLEKELKKLTSLPG